MFFYIYKACLVLNNWLLSVPKVEKGAFYDPALNADYGGPYFQHIHNKLVQLDVRDVHNELIAPWEFHRALRPGTLILANCTLHCFIMNDGGSERKVSDICSTSTPHKLIDILGLSGQHT